MVTQATHENMIKDINNRFNIVSINYCLEKIFVGVYDPDEDTAYGDTCEEVSRTTDICGRRNKHPPFNYDYECEVWSLTGVERKKCLKHMIAYIEEYTGELEFGDYKGYWETASVYAYLYIYNNSDTWFTDIILSRVSSRLSRLLN